MDDSYFMREALKEAVKAGEAGEVPVGAIIVAGNQIIAKAHNLTERLHDVTAHAEMQAFTAASEFLGGKYLSDCTLYVTLEPCSMCAGAAFWTQIGRVVFGASDLKRGYRLLSPSPLHPKTQVSAGILEQECSQLVKEFFASRRNGQ